GAQRTAAARRGAGAAGGRVRAHRGRPRRHLPAHDAGERAMSDVAATGTEPPFESGAVPPPPADGAGRLGRWSDRLNPILVREVRQALKARTFPLLVLGVLVGSIGIALGVTGDDAVHRNGRAFSIGLTALVPLVLFVVPMQAYHAMRTELRAGIVEQ